MSSPQRDRVLVTGISGFIAKHVAFRLLQRGYDVVGTVRTAEKSDATRQTLSRAGGDVSRLAFVEADLLHDEGWGEAAAGCRFVQHTASPFPMGQPRDKFALVPAAEGGTRRVIAAAQAAGVERIVLTSSVASIFYGHDERPSRRYDEQDFSRIESENISAYAVSKTMAERAAWQAVEGGATELSVVNPSLVFGPLLDEDAGTSALLVAMMMRGTVPFLPPVRFGIVDVRDVADAHLAAMTVPEAAGRRFIVSSESLDLPDVARLIAERLPAYRRALPRRRLPGILVRVAAPFSRRARMLAIEIDGRKELDNCAAKAVLGLNFRPAEEAVVAMARSLIEFGLVERRPA